MRTRQAGLALARRLSPLFRSRVGQAMLSDGARFLDALRGIGSGDILTAREQALIWRQVTEREPVMFDAGAHSGQFLRFAPADAAVHAFEPGTASFEKLTQHWGGNPRVRLNRCALSSEVGRGHLHFDPAETQLASLTPRRRFAKPQSQAVVLETLDRYCQAHGIDRIHLLKLDVEGHELEVLKGGLALLDRHAIRRILFEFGGCHIDSRVFFRDLYDFLSAHSLRIFRLSPSGLYPVSKYDETLERFQTTNYWATL